jgi:hypothetical protein
MNDLMLCKLSDDMNVYGGNDGSVVVYSLGEQHRYKFTDGIWAEIPVPE